MADEQTARAPERIDTLIPYREPTWRPLRRPPTLKDSDSSWASLGKLGRYLLSGEEGDAGRLEEIARAAYASILAEDPDAVRPIGDGGLSDLESRVRRLAGGTPVLFRDGGALVAAFTVPPRSGKWLGEHEWYMRGTSGRGTARIRGLKLPALVGAAALLGSVDEGETRRRLVDIASSRLRAAEDYIAHERESMSPGHLRRLERDRDRLEAELLDIVSGDGVRRALRRAVAAALSEDKWGGFDGALRGLRLELSSSFMAEERERDLNRRYADMAERGSSATVWTDKRNLDPAHVAVASTGFIGRSFAHVEIDDDVDLDVYARMQAEFEARSAARELPAVDASGLSLRFRKCGRHRAAGIYNPLLRTVVVDPRSPSSLLHEFAHAYDFAHGQVSCSRAFRPVLDSYKERLDALLRDEPSALEGVGHGGYDYALTPTEVFARSWEIWAASDGRGGSFVKPPDDYRGSALYSPLLENADGIAGFFETWLPASELPLPLEPGSWERAPAAHKGWEASGPGASIDREDWEAAPAGTQFRLFDPAEFGGSDR